MRRLLYKFSLCALLAGGGAHAQTFCNSIPIQIPATGTIGNASSYPSVISVTGVVGTIGTMSLDVHGLTHTYPEDIDMLLVGPGGQTLIVQSDAGTSVDVNSIHYKLRDGAPGLLSNAGAIVNGQYRPTNYGITADTFSAPAPAGPYGDSAPSGVATFASVFGGISPNGTWALYIVDDVAGDPGNLSGGWCLNFGDVSPLRISELRLRGPNGANDEYVELVNPTPWPTIVAAVDGSAGFALAASNGIARCTMPNGTVIPAMGHFLCANSISYSLADYPGGTTNTSADLTYTTEIPDNAGVALFNTATSANFTLTNRIDAVGSTSEANTLYKRGAGYPALTPFSIDSALVRDACGRGGSITAIGPCPNGGILKDTGNNAADFYFVDTNGTSAGAGQRLGAPGPESLQSPLWGLGDISSTRLDLCSSPTAAPNFVRIFTSDPATNSTFGTLDIRRTFTNQTGDTLTRLRFRIIDLSTFPAPTGVADLRARTSPDIVVSVDRPPCASGSSNVTVRGTTLEQPPLQPNAGGFNSSLSVNVSPGLPDGASIDVRFLLGIQQTGQYKFTVLAEGLPLGGGADQAYTFYGCTDPCLAPMDEIFHDNLEP